MRKLFYLFLCLGLFSQLSAQNYLWNQHYKSVNSESMVSTKCIAIDNEGYVYATGHFQGTASFGNLEVMTHQPYKPETFITKTSSDGELIWFKNLKGDDITARDIKIDQNGNIIIAGLFRGNLDLEGYTKFSIDTDVFILKLNNEGNVTWLTTTETQNVEVNGEFINGITDFGGFDIDDSGNVYATGVFIGYVNFDPKETEILYSPSSPSEWGSSFILKITADGTLGWVQQVYQSFGTAVKVSNNDLYVAGNFYRGNVDLNPSPNEEYIVFTESFSEGYLIHMDTSGNFIKALHTRGDMFTSVTYWEIEADEFGYVYLVGDYFGNVTFSYDGLHQYETEHLNNGFVMKINNEGNIIWFSDLKSISSVVYSISLNEQQEAYITGSFSGYIEAENNTQLYQTNNNWFERYIAKLDAEGNIMYNKGFAGGGESSDVKNSIKLKGDDIYLGGTFEGTVNLNPTDSMPVIVEAVGLDSYLIKLANRNMNVEDLEKSNFILYPNPSNGIYNIQANAKISGRPYEVYDLSGKKLSSGKIIRTNQIDLTLLPKGTYILKIDGKHSFKVIKR